MAVNYPDFGDFCDVAAEILGTTPKQIARLPNVGLAESALAAGVEFFHAYGIRVATAHVSRIGGRLDARAYAVRLMAPSVEYCTHRESDGWICGDNCGDAWGTLVCRLGRRPVRLAARAEQPRLAGAGASGRHSGLVHGNGNRNRDGRQLRVRCPADIDRANLRPGRLPREQHEARHVCVDDRRSRGRISVAGGPPIPTHANSTLPDGLRAAAVEVLRNQGKPWPCPRVTPLAANGRPIRKRGITGKPLLFRLPGTQRWTESAHPPTGVCKLTATHLPRETVAYEGDVANTDQALPWAARPRTALVRGHRLYQSRRTPSHLSRATQRGASWRCTTAATRYEAACRAPGDL